MTNDGRRHEIEMILRGDTKPGLSWEAWVGVINALLLCGLVASLIWMTSGWW